MTTDPKRIWLQPACCADPTGNRLWCQDNVWPDTWDCEKPGIEYIRADLVTLKEQEPK